ncbi:hypothetical protein CSW64_02195 [Caulobacter mirabilis]|uniref:Peptidase M1 membrane alanine aminopeptidase domain-containing protein n=1 Tax=Caulobacter mirabilis TaxID=69666 RepID=A0A2D2ATI7_9CAUL|nr:hypothetical protein CSW64_02195 [Caulobacter mirabilis]
MLAAHVAAFEIGRQARQPVVWVAGLLFFGFAVLLMSDDGFLGSPELRRNAPIEVAKALLILGVLYVFVSVALAGEAALRDIRSGFEPLVRATSSRRFTRLLGRFVGMQIVAGGLFLVVASGLLAGAVAPWVEPTAIGPFDWPAIGLAVIVVGLPAVTTPAAVFFALAAWLRSITAVYVALIVGIMILLILPGMMKQAGLPWMEVAATIEPFGMVAFLHDIRFLEPGGNLFHAFQSGLLIVNRVVGLGLSAAMLGLAFLLERREDEARLPPRQDPADAAVQPRLATASRRFGPAAAVLQFLARLRLETRLLLRSPSLIILAGLLLVCAILDLWSHNSLAGTPSLPATRVMADGVRSWLGMLSLIVTAFYAGEIVWRERDRRVDELIDSTPTPDAVILGAKIAAVASVLLILLSTGVLAVMVVQLGKRYFDATPDQYVALIIAPAFLQMVFLGAFSITAAALAPNRFAAWGLTAALLTLSVVAEVMGFAHPLYDFAATPYPTLSEMNPDGDGSKGFIWLSTYWTLWGALLLFGAWLFWRRGRAGPSKALLAQARRRLAGPGGAIAGVLAAATLAVGGYVFMNTNVWAWWATDHEIEAFQADCERDLAPYLDRPEPAIVDMVMKVDIAPSRTRLTAEGVYVIENRTGGPLAQVRLQLPSDADEVRVSVSGARSVLRRETCGLDVLAFDTPLRPGERRRLTFRTEIAPRGFGSSQNRVVRNGTFVDSHELAPVVGVTRRDFLTDADDRRRQGLEPEAPMLEPDAPGARDRNYLRADLAPLDITISTDADQVPVAPGRPVSDVRKDGRRTIRYVSRQPIRTFFSVQSARYEVRRVPHGPVDVAVFFHPGHGRNVDRMIAAMKGGLDVYQREFGPYQFDYLRIVEFPAYGDYGQAFAGTIPISENAGFIADLRSAGNFDYVTNLVLHEVAHQWWAHQVIGADAKGALLLSEGLAEYSAAMAQGRLQGDLQGGRAIDQSWLEYRKGRAERREDEPRLLRVERQAYVAYHRAAVTLAHVRVTIGEAALHRALRRFRDDHAFRAAPYPTSDDLLAVILEETPPKARAKVRALFERVEEPVGIGFAPAAKPSELK